jgi:hypothetical protein
MTRYPIVQTAAAPVAPRARGRAHCAPRVHWRSVLTVALGLLMAVAPAGAAMYKWLDANGRVVYSDQPPPANVKSEIVKEPPPRANPNAAKDLVNQETEIKLREKKQAEEAKNADKARADADRRREICAQALGQLKALQLESANLYRFNDKGEKVFLDDAARRSETEQLQQVVRENCPG